ncbi:hypothetical protein GIB67_005386 [Kingdonia uniflora]|uniref:Uncharacterized protein n=1 Tax=Kingdonia uniflora TaxID=39325 RepID=A0A7J7NHN3_9MAGN|nr:hypothetical protein GIB67_005386 [Kingdonia uniflora]
MTIVDHPSTSWSRDEDKLFERALVLVSEDHPNRWEIIASQVPGKTVMEVRDHYERLIHDVAVIDAGRVPLPSYADDDSEEDDSVSQISIGVSKTTERRKGVAWTVEEHKRFLRGLQLYGEGDWRSISRKVVVTRNPTQVASHAQKYFLRMNNPGKKVKKRSSIHDITTVEDNFMRKKLDAPSGVSFQQQGVQSISDILPMRLSQGRGGVSSGIQQVYGYPI